MYTAQTAASRSARFCLAKVREKLLSVLSKMPGSAWEGFSAMGPRAIRKALALPAVCPRTTIKKFMGKKVSPLKKTLSLLLALALLAALPVLVQADTWGTEDFTMDAPEGLYQLGPELPEDDPLWALAGVGDPASKLNDYREMGILANFISEDKQTSISVMRKVSDYSQQIHNLSLLSQEEQNQVLEKLIQSDSENLKVQRGWYPAGDILFYWVQLDMAGENPMHELLYGTIVNGYALNIDVYGGANPITPEQKALVEDLAASVHFTRLTEKPEPSPADTTGMLVLLALLLASVVVPLVYMPLKSKRDKKAKARLAEQLSQYHKTHGANQADGELLFANDTDCTKEAIHHFSVYQAYVKNIGELVFGSVLCLVMVACAFLLDTEWWMKLAAAAITGYYAYKLISMPNTIEKIQRKVFGRGQSQTAHYAFYPEVFRVSGVQSASVIPYFQLTDLRRKGQYLYLYYGPDNAYMVDQYGFTLGEWEAFQAFIREKTAKK